MNDVFITTHYRGATRRILINSERVLTLELEEEEPQAPYVLRFDTGYEMRLDRETGQHLERELRQINRPSPPVQYLRAPDYPRLPKRIRPLRPSCE